MDNEFEYKVIAQGPVVIITLSGRVSKSSSEKLERCKADVSSFKSQKIIFYFKEILSIDMAMYRSLVLLQHELRQRENQIFIVGLNNSLKLNLSEKGVIRSNELRSNLKELLLEIS